MKPDEKTDKDTSVDPAQEVDAASNVQNLPQASTPVQGVAVVDETPVEPVALPAPGQGVPDDALVVTTAPAADGPIVMTHPQVSVAATAVNEDQARHLESLGWKRTPDAANRVGIDANGLRRPDPEPTEES